jgi:hypothetical protein
MDGKSGLEALAALASKVSGCSRQSPEEKESTGSMPANNGNNHPSESHANAMSLPGTNPAISNVSASVMSQQIQQILAGAARFNNTNNFGNPNHQAILSSLQQLSNNNSGGDPSGLLALQQQINYYQCLAGQQCSALTSNQTGNSTLGDAMHAISLALTGRIQPSVSSNVILGKFSPLMRVSSLYLHEACYGFDYTPWLLHDEVAMKAVVDGQLLELP